MIRCKNEIKYYRFLEDYDPTEGIDYNVPDVINATAWLDDLNSSIDASVDSLSSIDLLPGVADNGSYDKALKCVTGKGIGKGFKDNVGKSLNRAKSLRNALLEERYGISGKQFDEMIKEMTLDEIKAVFASIEEGELPDFDDPALESGLAKFAHALLNGAGIGIANPEFAKSVAKLTGSNPAAASMVMLIFGSLVSGLSTEDELKLTDWNNAAKAAIYAFQSGLGDEQLAADFFNSLGLEGVAGGTAALFAVNMLLNAADVLAEKGSDVTFKDFIENIKPSTLMESAIWTIAASASGNPIVGNVFASVTTTFLEGMFTNADGKIDENGVAVATLASWLTYFGVKSLGAAELASLVAAGETSFLAGTAASAVTPVGWAILAFVAAAGVYYGIQEYDPNREASPNPSNTGNPWSWRDFQPDGGNTNSTVTTDENGVETVTASDNQGNSVTVKRNPDGSYTSTEHRSDGSDITRAGDGNGNSIEITRYPDGSSEFTEYNSDGTVKHVTVDSQGNRTEETTNSGSK